VDEVSMSATRIRESRRRYGAVLVLVLVVLAMLSLLAFGLCHRVRLELKMARMASDELRAYYLAMGGIRRAMVAIRQDEDNELDYFQEPWRLAANAVDEGLLALPEDGAGREAKPGLYLAYAVSDEEGRLNVNTSSPAGWVNLPGVDESLIYAIVDWQDEDQTPTRDGAESDYYQREVYPHAAKDAATTMVWELALIRNVSWWGMLGEDVNGNGLLDDVEDDGATRWPLDNADGRLNRGLADYFTVYGDGKGNLNTASYEVLSALPDIGPAGKPVADNR